MRTLSQLFAVWLAAFACSKAGVDEPRPQGEIAASKADIAPQIDVVLRIGPPPMRGAHTVMATTNLPDSTRLAFTISSKTSPDETYQANDDVRQGVAIVGPFGRGGGLPVGEYEVDVKLRPFDVQFDSVKRIIGSTGDNLTGPLVKRSKVGTTLHRTLTFRVGGDSGIPPRSPSLAQAEGIIVELRQLEAQTTNAALYIPGDALRLARCRETMPHIRRRVEALRPTLQPLPDVLYRPLDKAAAALITCNSCAPTGASCSSVEPSLLHTEAVIRAAL